MLRAYMFGWETAPRQRFDLLRYTPMDTHPVLIVRVVSFHLSGRESEQRLERRRACWSCIGLYVEGERRPSTHYRQDRVSTYRLQGIDCSGDFHVV